MLWARLRQYGWEFNCEILIIFLLKVRAGSNYCSEKCGLELAQVKFSNWNELFFKFFRSVWRRFCPNEPTTILTKFLGAKKSTLNESKNWKMRWVNFKSMWSNLRAGRKMCIYFWRHSKMGHSLLVKIHGIRKRA